MVKIDILNAFAITGKVFFAFTILLWVNKPKGNGREPFENYQFRIRVGGRGVPH